MIKKQPMFATAEAVEEAFYEALEAGDVEALMHLWCEDEDVVCIHPSGHRLVGLAAIRSSMLEILEGGGLQISVSDLRAHHNGTMAVHHVVEQITVSADEGQQLIVLAATNIYTKGPRGWQILLHQATPISAEEVESVSSGVVLH